MQSLHTTEPQTRDAMTFVNAAVFLNNLVMLAGAVACVTLLEPRLEWACFFLVVVALLRSAAARNGWCSPMNGST
jgi:hypothetical protein